jgi:tRNA A37 N6-isopentenylltransferase MiaA
VVARAYIDQLARSSALAPQRITALNAAIARVDASHDDRKGVAQLKSMGVKLDKEAAAAKTPADAERMHALAAIIKQSGASRL